MQAGNITIILAQWPSIKKLKEWSRYISKKAVHGVMFQVYYMFLVKIVLRTIKKFNTNQAPQKHTNWCARYVCNMLRVHNKLHKNKVIIRVYQSLL